MIFYTHKLDVILNNAAKGRKNNKDIEDLELFIRLHQMVQSLV